jgi:magnesium-transporting ATPase (P-type)
MEEGLLTGESKVSGKHPDVLAANIDLTDKANMMFSGTLVAKGKGIGVVIATGMSTEMGII